MRTMKLAVPLLAMFLSAFAGRSTAQQPRSVAAAALRQAVATESTPALPALLAASDRAQQALVDDPYAAALAELGLRARWRALSDPAAAAAELAAQLEGLAGDMAFRPVLEAELPVGFPAPTPVGLVEAKRYPRYRMARAAMGGDGRGDGAFWQLFGHIKRNEIAMTAPVETTFAEAGGELRSASMAFLYGAPELGAAGRDGDVEVVDIAPVEVVSIGCRGPATAAAIAAARGRLEAWLADREDLEVAGELRTMGYNSPMVASARRFFEVQIPIRRVGADSSVGSPAAAAMLPVVDFTHPAEAGRWTPINDVVMGGVSQSRFVSGDAGCVFAGELSLANNGGFASVRSRNGDYGLDGADGLVLRCRGDGKRYKLRVRTTDAFDGPSYEVAFDTVAGQWTEHRFAAADFRAVFRGRPVRAEPLDLGRARNLGLLISDKQQGPFRLEVAAIARF